MAQIDTSIYANLLRPPKTVQQYDDEAQQRQMNALQLRSAQASFDQQQEGLRRQSELRNLLAGGADASALRRGGYIDEAGKIEKDAAEIGVKNAQGAKYEADAQQSQLKAAADQLSMIYNAASGARDQQSYTMALRGLQAAGIDVSGIPPQFDPAYVEGAKVQALTQIQRVEQALKQQQFAETARHNRAQEGVAQQRVGVAQGNLAIRAAGGGGGGGGSPVATGQAPRNFGKAPSGYRYTANGDLEAIPGGPADKGGPKVVPPTEGERNAAGYMMRMDEASKLLDKFEKTGTATYTTEIAGAVPFVGGAARRAAMTPAQQQYRQAQEDWVRAKLRKESGASIAKDEMDREIEAYFPMPGDGPEVVAQKRQSRAVANSAMRQSAGRASATQEAPKPKGGVVNFGDLK